MNENAWTTAWQGFKNGLPGVLTSTLSNGIANNAGSILSMPMDITRKYIGMRMTEASQQRQMDWYMDKYGSPEARMRMMSNAGINPFAAAAGIAGSGGSSGSSAPQGAVAELEGSSEAGENVADTGRQMAEQDLLKSQKEGQDIQNKINEDTMEYQKQTIIENYNKSAAEAQYWKYYADNYPRILEGNVANLNKDLDVKGKQIDLYAKQINEIDQKIKNLEEEINLMKTQESYYKASAGELGARQALEEKQTQLTAFQVQRQDWENKVAELYGGDSILATRTELDKVSPGLGQIWYQNYLNAKFETQMMESAGNTAGQSPAEMAEMRGMLKDRIDAANEAYNQYQKYVKYVTEVQKLSEALVGGIVAPGYADKNEMIRAIQAYSKAAGECKQKYGDFVNEFTEEYNKNHVGLIIGTEAWSLVKNLIPTVTGFYLGGKSAGVIRWRRY